MSQAPPPPIWMSYESPVGFSLSSSWYLISMIYFMYLYNFEKSSTYWFYLFCLIDVSENNDTSLTSDGDDDLTLKRASMVSNDISPRGWKNSLESLLDTEELPSSPDRCPEELISHKKVSSVDNLHLKPLASLPSTEVKTSSSSKASSLGSSKGMHIYNKMKGVVLKYNNIDYIQIHRYVINLGNYNITLRGKH